MLGQHVVANLERYVFGCFRSVDPLDELWNRQFPKLIINILP